MSRNNKSAGFAVFEILVVVVVLVLIGFVGYTIYNRQNADKPGTVQQESDPTVADDVQDAPEIRSEEDLDNAEQALDEASLDASLSDGEELDRESSDL